MRAVDTGTGRILAEVHDGIGWIRPRSANRLGSLMGRVLGGGGRIRGTTRT